MLDGLKRFMVHPVAVVLLFAGLTAWTWFALGWEAAWRFGVLLAVLGMADLAIGWEGGLTLSEQVNKDWHSNPHRYIMWIVGVVTGLLLLHFHFTGA